jgi:hypothetical protein
MGHAGSNNDAGGGGGASGRDGGRDGSWTDPTSEAARAALLLLAELPAHLKAIDAGLGDERLDGVRDVARVVRGALEHAISPDVKEAARKLLSELDKGGAIAPLREQVAPLVALCREAMDQSRSRATGVPPAGPRPPGDFPDPPRADGEGSP